MKQKQWIMVLVVLSALALCLPAMAQTTGIEVDGKTYTFTGGEGIYQANGKTFIIIEDMVMIREPGKPEKRLSLSRAADTEPAEDTVVFIEQGVETASTTASSVETVVTEDVQSSAAADASGGTESGGVITEYDQSTYTMEGSETVNAERFAPYAKFGLYYDANTGVLTYQGQRVHIFEDSYPLEDQACAALEHVDAEGTVDVRTQRDQSVQVYNADGSIDPSGTLTGLYRLTDAEFAARKLSDWIQPQQEGTATSGEEMTPAEKQTFFAPYAAFGLSYDAASDELTYQGQRVRQFTDIRQGNGEALESGHFQGVLTCIGGESGEVDVETIRDFNQPNAAGDGLLIGMIAEKVR